MIPVKHLLYYDSTNYWNDTESEGGNIPADGWNLHCVELHKATVLIKENKKSPRSALFHLKNI